MFWGIVLAQGKKEKVRFESGVKITMAALEGEGTVSVFAKLKGKDLLLCTLKSSVLFQQQLHAYFGAGEEVNFYTNGNGKVHLTGCVLPTNYEVDSDEEFLEDAQFREVSQSEDEEEEEEPVRNSAKKRKAVEKLSAKKRRRHASDSDSDENILDSQASEGSGTSYTPDCNDLDYIYDKGGSSSDEDMNNILLGSDIEDNKTNKKSKKAKSKSPSPGNTSKASEIQNGNLESSEKKKKRKKKNKKNSPAAAQDDNSTPGYAPKVQNLPGGLKLEDQHVGNGPLAKVGTKIVCFYTGRLQNGTIFDSNRGRKPLKFRLGSGEVIKGWDLGIQGMRVGGKRKITIPPNLGYGGNRQASIPPNSTLVFDVELKSIA